MSTRSLTVFMDDDHKEIAVMYKHSDGYPEDYGKDLAEFIKDIEITNGISYLDTQRTANGMECLAAQIVSHFKKNNPSGIYLYAAKTRNMDEEYIYIIKKGSGKYPKMEVLSDLHNPKKPVTIFCGTGLGFLNFIK